MEFVKRNVKIIILSGKAGSGKSTIANILKSKLNKTIVLSYASYLKEIAKNVLSWNGEENTKPRDFLQQVGVELIKNQIDDKLLINRVIEDIKVYSYFYDYIIISDARFIDEINLIKDNFDNVKVIHVVSDNDNLTKEQKKHSTETSLDNFNDYDYEIYNDLNLDNLNRKIESIVGEL